MKGMNHLKTILKIQGASSNLRMVFALSKLPHFNSAYLVRVPFSSSITVFAFTLIDTPDILQSKEVSRPFPYIITTRLFFYRNLPKVCKKS